MKTFWLLALLIVGLFFGGACATDGSGVCRSNIDCAVGEVCTAGSCGKPSPASVCVVGQNCDKASTEVSVCHDGETNCKGNVLRRCRPDGRGWYDIDCGAFHQCVVGACQRKVLSAACGNGIIEGKEQCDDGNRRSGDGCSRYCLLEKVTHFEPPARPSAPSTFVLGNDFCRSAANRAEALKNKTKLYIKIVPTVCRQDGTPAVSQETLKANVALLNEVFASAGITFVLMPTKWEDNADRCEVFYDTESHDTLKRYAQADAISVFYAFNISGGSFSIAGFANFTGIVMKTSSRSEAGISRTLAHEMGHALGLDHPHACRNGEEDGDNCETHGDQLCDTPRDPGPKGISGLAFCGDEQKDGQCTVTREGGTCKVSCPGGETPLVDNLMSYYHCGSALTSDQFATVRCIALNDQNPRVSAEKPCLADADCGALECIDGYCKEPVRSCVRSADCGDELQRCIAGSCGACVADGKTAGRTFDCCSKMADRKRVCCSGKSCCSTRNFARLDTSGQCVCFTGFERVNPNDPSDVRCKRPASATRCFARPVIEGHTGSVTAVAFAPDSKSFVSVSYDKSVRLWQTLTRKQLKLLEGHTSFITSVAFGADGKSILSGDTRKHFLRWDVTAGKQSSSETLEQSIRHIGVRPGGGQIALALSKGFSLIGDDNVAHVLEPTEFIRKVAYHPDAKRNRLVVVNNRKVAMIYNTDTRKMVRKLDAHAKPIFSVGYSHDGKLLATGSDELRLWNPSTGKLIRKWKTHRNYTYALAWHPSRRVLFTGGLSEASIKLWDADTGKIIQTLEGHTRVINTLAVSPDGKWLVSGSADKTIRVWYCR